MTGKRRNPNLIRPTNEVRMMEQPDGTTGFHLMTEYEEVIPAGVPWSRLIPSAVVAGLLVLVAIGGLNVWGWLTGSGVSWTLTTCATHLAHSPIPTAIPTVPPH